MTETAQAQEPTMEEILASIRKIISEGDVEEESPPEAAPAAVVEEEEEVVELRELVEDERQFDVPAPPPPPRPTLVEPLPEVEQPPLVSTRTADAGTAAFSQLVNAVHGPWPLGDANQTVEGMVLTLLKPLLKDWLDAHLPGLVEELVRHEIEGMVRRARPDVFKKP
jgi:cell pole-organizing protein PopZ